jgi:tetratricopeptide (TPR) repeat protein
MDVEIENARAAWNWAAVHKRVGHLDTAVEGLSIYYERRLRNDEGETACRLAAELLSPSASGDDLRVLAGIMTWQSVFNDYLGKTEIANQLLEQSLEILESPELADRDIRAEKAFIYLYMGDIAWKSIGNAERIYQQSLDLYQSLEDHWGMARVFNRLGYTVRVRGDTEKAKKLQEESLTIRRKLGDYRGIIGSLEGLFLNARIQGHFDEAETLAHEALALCQEIGDEVWRSQILYTLGWTLESYGKFTEAHPLYEEKARIDETLGDRKGMIMALKGLACHNIHLGNYEQAKIQLQLSQTLAKDLNVKISIGFNLFELGNIGLVQEAHFEAEQLLQESIRVFQELGFRNETCIALAVLGMAKVALRQLPQAQENLTEVLKEAIELKIYFPPIYGLCAAAWLLAAKGEVERPIELYTLAESYPFVANSCWFEDVVGKRIAEVVASLPPEVAEAAKERGKARDLDATIAELLEEFSGE